MGLLSPLENSELELIRGLLKLHFCKWHFSPIFTQPDQIKLFLLISSNKFLLNGYKHSGTLFLGSSYHYLFKNIAHVQGICRFYPNCIFVFVLVYLCICFVYLHVRDLWTLLFRSWYHFLFKNIALVGSICKYTKQIHNSHKSSNSSHSPKSLNSLYSLNLPCAHQTHKSLNSEWHFS